MWRGSFMAALATLACGALSAGSSVARARDVPPLVSRVTDTAGLLDSATQGTLEAELKAYAQRTGRQFAVLVVSDLQDEAIEEYAMRVAEAWHLGRKPQDDGLLLLIVVQQRRMRIEVGYGLEGDITDALSSRVIHDILRPAFRQRAFGPGIAQAMHVLMQAADKSPVEGLLPRPQDEEDDTRAGQGLILLVVVLLLLFGPRWLLPALMLMGDGPRGRGGGSGGGFSGGGGDFGGGGASGGW